MTYKETLDFLYSSLPAYQRIGAAAYKADLKTTYLLDKHLGKPHLKFKSVHIAGTNGKGSVSHMLASVLSEAGYRTGLYTSPHLRDFRERIKVGGSKISEDYVVRFVDKHGQFFSELKPSFFEMTVAMAFQYFKDMKVDVAVIETGMGGRLYSTNIIKHLLSVITNISLDHVRFLGSSKGGIASEKAGIIKLNTPVVIGRTDPDTVEVFRDVAESHNSIITFADNEQTLERNPSTDISRLKVNVLSGKKLLFRDLESGLSGACQIENIATVLSSIAELRNFFEISDTEVQSGLSKVVENTGIEGRWQIKSKLPLTICDTAHNLDGLLAVIKELIKLSARTTRLILGFSNDKDVGELFKVFPQDWEYYLTRASVERSMSVKTLSEEASKSGISFRVYDSVGDAYSQAKIDSLDDDMIYVGGSTFIVADFLELFE
jgi:dihydrofolate synthase/folylpolyglutamate synthase